MLKRTFLLLLLLPVLAHSAHITDKLLAGMYAKPNSAEQPVQLLPSGTPVELMGEQDGFVKVQLVDGKTGWVEKRFLSEEKPAKVRLLALQSKYRELQGKLDVAEEKLAGFSLSSETPKSVDLTLTKKLQVALAKAKSEILLLQRQVKQRAKPEEKEAKAVKANKTVSQSGSEGEGIASWLLGILMLVVGGVIGLIVGMRIQDARQLKRHGGFRV